LQIRFALVSSSVFSRTDTVTDSERFYNSILEIFEDLNEKEEVDDLLVWWNRYVCLCSRHESLMSHFTYSQVFPSYSSARTSTTKNSVLAKIREKRALKLAAAENVVMPE
jgi:hypothetical protein